MKRERAAAISAASFMLVAGCAGGHSAGGPPPSAPQSAASTARAYLEIDIPAGSAAIQRRRSATGRRTSYISPATSKVSIAVTNGSQTIYQTALTIGPPACTPAASGPGYLCAVDLPVGTYTLYATMYDQSGGMLSTNLYANQAPITIYANGSNGSNNLTIPMQGVVAGVLGENPHNCFFAFPHGIPIDFLDAGHYPIVGPLANPVTFAVTPVNGAGQGAIDIYAYYGGTPHSIDGVPVTDTSIYSPVFLNIGGPEGAVSGTFSSANIPLISGQSSTTTLTAAKFRGFASNNGLYGLAIEQTNGQVMDCGGAGDDFINPAIVNSMRDGSGAGSEVVVLDGNTVYVVGLGLSVGTQPYVDFFAPNPHAYFHYATYTPPANESIYNLLTSGNVFGRVDVISQNVATGLGHMDLVDVVYGAPTDLGLYSFGLQVPTQSTSCCTTWAASASTVPALYYTLPGTAVLYALDRTTGSALPPLSFAGTPLAGGQIYAIAASGPGFNTIFVRGASPAGQFYICAFDAAQASPSIFCHATMSMNTSDASLRYDTYSGNVLWASGGTAVYALNAHQTPANFVAGLFPPAVYTLSHPAFRIVASGGAPGVVGLYGGPPGQVTLLKFTGSGWGYLATFPWPNGRIAIVGP